MSHTQVKTLAWVYGLNLYNVKKLIIWVVCGGHELEHLTDNWATILSNEQKLNDGTKMIKTFYIIWLTISLKLSGVLQKSHTSRSFTKIFNSN